LSLTTLVAGLNVGGPPSDALCRRSVLTNAATALLAAPLVSPLAAVADVYGPNSDMPSGEKKVNSFLQQQGFPAMKVPGGCSPLVGYIGTAPPANIDGSKSKERAFDKSLLVRFVYPNGWLPEVPSITENGESGTLGANNYVKGDSATFTAVPLKGNTLQSLSSNKEFFKNFLSAQMTSDVFEDVKPKKITVVKQDDGTEMVLLDFSYTLLTRAGFTVNRLGAASAMIVGDTVVGLVTATTALRYKELEEKLHQSASSFRAYVVKPPAFSGSII